MITDYKHITVVIVSILLGFTVKRRTWSWVCQSGCDVNTHKNISLWISLRTTKLKAFLLKHSYAEKKLLRNKVRSVKKERKKFSLKFCIKLIQKFSSLSTDGLVAIVCDKHMLTFKMILPNWIDYHFAKILHFVIKSEH